MMVDNSGISLQVYEIEANDKDRDIVRIDPDIMHKLNISDGDFISVIGLLSGTKIICLSLLPSDKNKQIIRIDSKTRNLIGTTIGDTVIIKKVALINEENNKARKMNAAEESDEVSNSIIVNGSCIDFEKERPKIMEFLKSLEKEIHSDTNYFKCYSSGKKTLGWDFLKFL